MQIGIAGTVIALEEPEGRRLLHWPAQAYEPFLRHGAAPDLRFGVSVSRSLPEVPKGRRVFAAEDGSWSLHERLEGFLFESLDPVDGRPFNRALISPDYSCGTIFTRAEDGGAWNPSKAINPIVELCLLTKLAFDGALMLHAAGVDYKGGGWVFTGPSGAGKSTLSALFVERGALILNDERVVVTDGPNGPVVHGTPWCGSNPIMNDARAPLKRLYFIRHGQDEHRIRPLRKAEAAALCVRQAFLPYWDPAAMDATLRAAERLFDSLDGVELSFLIEASAVDFLTAKDSDHAEDLVERIP